MNVDGIIAALAVVVFLFFFNAAPVVVVVVVLVVVFDVVIAVVRCPQFPRVAVAVHNSSCSVAVEVKLAALCSWQYFFVIVVLCGYVAQGVFTHAYCDADLYYSIVICTIHINKIIQGSCSLQIYHSG